jgi:1,4-alpha-glucan branching enzyme
MASVMSRQTGFLSDFDLHLIKESTHYRLWERLGAHLVEIDGRQGVRFAVWAPSAEQVAVVGDFNDWDDRADPLQLRDDSGIWEGFVPDLAAGALYKYAIMSRGGEHRVLKTDPFGFACELRPQTASKVHPLDGYQWGDREWLATRGARQALDAPVSIYEVHLGSWMRVPEEEDRWLSYRELAERLVAYVSEMGFTHVELMPVCEHPLDESWGYQTVGYFAATSRFGSPQDFMHLIDTLHQAGIGVILDWVPAHFPRDEHGLGYFDGTHLFEHADPRQGEQQDWGTFVYNYGRTQVCNFLLANALYWLDVFHIDGLRVDAVASMLYLDYSRAEGQWVANRHGGRENLEAIEFLRLFNEVVYREHPDVMTIAEESTAWPGVSRPLYVGGLGFGLKWNMGWMNDTLAYFSLDGSHRQHHHEKLTFGLTYAFQENFVLPLSHDEVVHGKGSLLGRMPGDRWQKFANLRALFGYMFTQNGKKLLFMGGEFGQWDEWNHARSLDWHLLAQAPHRGLQRWVRDLNTLLRGEPALHELDCDAAGFQWLDAGDRERSILSYVRFARDRRRAVVCVCNLTPVPRHNYRLGVPHGGHWDEILNSDAPLYGGSGQGNLGGAQATPVPAHRCEHSLNITLPPLAVVLFRPAG